MAQDSEGDRSQKTVAELLAQHGGSSGGGRRRHRRAAEEAVDTASEDSASVSDTAPQAIIDRVHGEDTAGDPGQAGQGPARPRQQSPTAEQTHRHDRQDPRQPSAGQQQQPPRQPLRPRPVQQPSTEQPVQSRPARQPQQAPGGAPAQQQSRPSQRPAAPGSGQEQRTPPPGDETGTGETSSVSARLDGSGTRSAQRPETDPGQEISGGSADTGRGRQDEQAQPGAARARGRSGFPKPSNGWRSPLRPARRAEPEPNTDQLPVVSEDSGQSSVSGTGRARSAAADSDTGPAVPETGGDVPAGAPPAGLAKWRQRRKKEQTEDTEVNAIPPVPPAPTEPDDSREQEGPAAHEDAGPPTGAFTPTFDTGAQSAVAPGAAPEEVDDYVDDLDEDGYTEEDFAEDDLADEDFDEFGDSELEDRDLDEDDLDEGEEVEQQAEEGKGSPGRQWLVLAGQLTLGVLGGAGVWLGFSWLWGTVPSAALVAALLITLVLVWVVRRIRHAEDTQTTVLAILVGLVVTVSPAALLLVSR